MVLMLHLIYSSYKCWRFHVSVCLAVVFWHRHRVVLWADTDVSKEYAGSFFRVKVCRFRITVRYRPTGKLQGKWPFDPKILYQNLLNYQDLSKSIFAHEAPKLHYKLCPSAYYTLKIPRALSTVGHKTVLT
jgi:hypothetical protein